MRKIRMIAFSVTLTGLVCAASGQGNPVLVGTVIRVIDGDTIAVQLDSGPITVRFDSIDAPERNQPWGIEAREMLARLLDGHEVALDVMSQDRYERLVAVVHLGDRPVNIWMVEQGYAWAYRQYLSSEDYCAREHEARSEGRGLWAQAPSEWMAPWEWRRFGGSSASAITDYSSETVASCIATMGHTAAAPTAPATRSRSSPSKCLIKGNISDNGRIYHVPGNRHYDATRIDESRGERWFCTVEEARAAGWRPPR